MSVLDELRERLLSMENDYRIYENFDGAGAIEDVREVLDAFTVEHDLAEVVRCKDCRYSLPSLISLGSFRCEYEGRYGLCHVDDYCSYGERRQP